jgi:alkanesulfonate monooxygenase SsuD/methylene tetrahydromethanopterin reductase-like flavin-dependent oxidoreductase (luciferase family)
MSRVQFGFCVPVFAMPGARFFRVPAWTSLDPPLAVDAAVEAERLGFDSVWVADHLLLGGMDGILEGWTTLCVIAGRTQRVKLGPIHMAQALRPPAMGAKMTATLDALSGGRFILFYDWGGEAESRAYGLPYPAEAERVSALEEGLERIQAMGQAQAPLDFSTTHYAVQGAICRPAPLQRPPPIWIGEARSEAWLDMVCRQADGFNSTPATPQGLAEKLAQLHAACRRTGRDPSSFELSLEMQILIAPSEAEAKAMARQIADLPPRVPESPPSPPRPVSGRPSAQRQQMEALQAYLHDPGDQRPLSALVPNWLAGTPAAVQAQLQRYVELGVSHFMLWFLDFPSLEGMRLFASQVAPQLR